MSKKGMALCLAVFLICVGIAAWAGEKSLNRVVSERPIDVIDTSSWISESFIVSPDSKRVAYIDVRNGVILAGKSEWNEEPTTVFTIQRGGPLPYDGIIEGTPILSPDSERVAYVAGVGNKWFVVVDGEEGKRYDGFVRGGRVIFDFPDSLHYLALETGIPLEKGSSSIYPEILSKPWMLFLVEERIE